MVVFVGVDGWQGLGSGGVALTGSPGVAYDPGDGSFHAFGLGLDEGLYQTTYTPASGWASWQDLGGQLQGGLNAGYVAP